MTKTTSSIEANICPICKSSLENSVCIKCREFTLPNQSRMKQVVDAYRKATLIGKFNVLDLQRIQTLYDIATLSAIFVKEKVREKVN